MIQRINNNNFELRIAIQSKLKNFLLQRAIQCNNELENSLNNTILVIKDLDLNFKFNSGIYCLYFELEKAIKIGYEIPIRDILKSIEALLSSEFRYITDINIKSILEDSWERYFVEHMRQYEPLDKEGKKTIVFPIDRLLMVEHTRQIRGAISLIKTLNNEIFEEYLVFVTSIKLFDGRVLRGETAIQSFGSIYLRLPPKAENTLYYWVEHIVHEISHLKLEALINGERLVNNSNYERYDAPIRKDPRPMIGIFHATFVLSRMVRVFKELSKIDTKSNKVFHKLESQLNKGKKCLNENAIFTDLGKQIYEKYILN